MYSEQFNIYPIGSIDNLKKELNSECIIDNPHGHIFLACHITPPTNSSVTFYGTFDGTNWDTFSLRSTNNDIFQSSCTSASSFVGFIIGMKKIKFVTNALGNADGTIIGSLTKQTATLESIEFGYPPHRFGFAPVHKDASFTTQQTDTAIWTPESGKRIVVTDLDVIVGGATDGIVSIFNGAGDTIGNRLFRASVDVSTNKNMTYAKSYVTPYIGATNGAVKITTSAGMTVDVILHGYEII